MQKLAERFGVHWRTVQNWVNRFRMDGSVGPKRDYKRGPQPKISDERLPEIERIVGENNALSQQELCHEIESRLEVQVSRATAGRALKRLLMTKKKNILSE